MEREVGGGIGMGNTCKPKDVSFQCMTKSTTNKKIKIKINKKIKRGIDNLRDEIISSTEVRTEDRE